MRPERVLIAAFFALLAGFGGHLPAAAQDGTPAVQVDLSVLGGTGNSAPATQAPPLLRQPRGTALLTLPEPPPKPVIDRPQQAAVSPPPVPARPPEPDSAAGREAVMFPVQVKNRSDEYDPSLGISAPVMAAVAPAAKEKTPALPDFKPVPVAKPRQWDTTKKVAHTTIPLPGHKPAAPERVAGVALPQKAAQKVVIKDQDISTVRMPAVPARRVEAESLPAGGLELLTPDKHALVQAIEEVDARARALALKNPQGSKQYVDNPRSAVAKQLAAVEPAAGLEKIAASKITGIPRLPPAGTSSPDYVSVALAEDSAGLAGDVIAALDRDVLPRLKQQAGTRLQIQSFASDTDPDRRNDARRTSLSRALAVRDHLMQQGIEASRMDVRALGAQTDRTPVDRIDLVFLAP